MWLKVSDGTVSAMSKLNKNAALATHDEPRPLQPHQLGIIESVAQGAQYKSKSASMLPSKVFISATSTDLGGTRQVVKDALLTIGCYPFEQTTLTSDWRNLAEMLRGIMSDCQALIHIARLRYGAEADPTTLPAKVSRRS